MTFCCRVVLTTDLGLSEYYKEHSNVVLDLPNCDHLADCLVKLPMFYEMKDGGATDYRNNK